MKPSPVAVSTAFSRTLETLVRYDANLEANENRRTYPAPGWRENYRALAKDLDTARIGFMQLKGPEGPLQNSLQQDVINIGDYAGQIKVMSERRITYGSGWGTVLNQSIADTKAAIESLASAPAPKAS